MTLIGAGIGVCACGGGQSPTTQDAPDRRHAEQRDVSPPGPDCSTMTPADICDGPVGESRQCGELTSGACPNVTAQCECAEGLYCVGQSCRKPPEGEIGEDGTCVPYSQCPFNGHFMEVCGDVPAGCGAMVYCGCEFPLECQSGMCLRANGGAMPCDPHSTRDVCGEFRGEGASCGKQSAGCTGAYVHCPCEGGTTCRDGVCRR